MSQSKMARGVERKTTKNGKPNPKYVDLLDEDKPIELDRAKAVADIAQVIINSAKVEVDYVKATERSRASSGFFPENNNGSILLNE